MGCSSTPCCGRMQLIPSSRAPPPIHPSPVLSAVPTSWQLPLTKKGRRWAKRLVVWWQWPRALSSVETVAQQEAGVGQQWKVDGSALKLLSPFSSCGACRDAMQLRWWLADGMGGFRSPAAAAACLPACCFHCACARLAWKPSVAVVRGATPVQRSSCYVMSSEAWAERMEGVDRISGFGATTPLLGSDSSSTLFVHGLQRSGTEASLPSCRQVLAR